VVLKFGSLCRIRWVEMFFLGLLFVLVDDFYYLEVLLDTSNIAG
jgi:hypothetical protein